MGINAETQAAHGGKAHFFPVFRADTSASFVVKWRAFQHQRAFLASRLDSLSKGISETAATPRRFLSRSVAVVVPFRKLL